MYIDIIKETSLKDYITNEFKIYAHKNNDKYETLEEHINLCEKYFINIVKDKNIEPIFLNFERMFLEGKPEEVKSLFRRMLVGVIKFHDIGKINPLFQKRKMDNDLRIVGIEQKNDTKHSIISAIIYIDIFLKEILALTKDKNIREVLINFMIFNSYVISRHHSGFKDFRQFKDIIFNGIDEDDSEFIDEYNILCKEIYDFGSLSKKKLRAIKKNIDRYNEELKSNVEKIKAIYIYQRIMLSILIACDFYATSEFMNGIEIRDFGSIDDIEEFYDEYKKSDIYNFIREYEKIEYYSNKDLTNITDINILRDELFLDAEKELEKNIDKNIFYLEAPTGSGKSNTANNLAFKLLQLDKVKRKIFYVYPFNTLIEQNLKNLTKIYNNTKEVLNNIAVINSLYSIKVSDDEKENEEFEKYEKALLNRQFLNYPMILTTHVSIFRYLFGVNKEDVFPVYQLANSVIILDEIQSYRNIIWGEIIEFLHSYSELLNIKIIIMSATLPNLEQLICYNNQKTVKLIENREKYFMHPIFKNRVKLNFDLIDSEDIYEDIFVLINNFKGKKILVEFINKNSAYDYYNFLNDRKEIEGLDTEVLLMTGDDNYIERENILDRIKSLSNVVLVATQVIEAGVDIDMDIGFKDISILDSEEQFLGRINRSCLKEEAIVYFFNKDKTDLIYKEDIRKNEELTLECKEMREVLEGKEFEKYYSKVLMKNKEYSSCQNKYNKDNFFLDDVLKLKFEKIEERMKLIEDNNNDISVFLSRVIDNGVEVLDGEEIWKEYKFLLRDNKMNYAERKVRLSQVLAKMNNFIYKIRFTNLSYNDRIGELIKIDNGEEYFKDGKLDKKKFEGSVGELFI